MVHKKYTWKNGKRYGPYLYENKRVEGRVVTSYVGKDQKRSKETLLYISIGLVLVALFFLILYVFVGEKMIYLGPGSDIELDQEVYVAGSQILGSVQFSLVDVLKSSSNLVVSFGDSVDTYSVSDFVDLDYPDVEFELLISVVSESEEEVVSGGSSGSDETGLSETSGGETDESSVLEVGSEEDSGEVDETDVSEVDDSGNLDPEAVKEEVVEVEESVEDSSSSVEPEDSPSESEEVVDVVENEPEVEEPAPEPEQVAEPEPVMEESSEPMLSPELGVDVSGLETVSVVGSVNVLEDFVRDFDSEILDVEIVSAVSEDVDVSDMLSFEIEGNGLTVSTSYGFIDSFDVSLDSLGLVAPEENSILRIEVVDGDEVFAFAEETVLIEGYDVLDELLEDESEGDIGDLSGEVGMKLGVAPQWVKEIEEVGPKTVTLQLPAQATVVSVEKIAGETFEPSELEEVVSEDSLDSKEILFSPEDFKNYELDLDEGDVGALVVYETPAPTMSFIEETSVGLKVGFYAPTIPDHPYKDVEVFVDIPEDVDASHARIYHVNSGKFVEFDIVEDRLVWYTDLSEQIFEIIFVSRAEHLDSSREFTSDISEEVGALDGVWSETINEDEFVRVVFERELDSSRDITVYPRIVSGSPLIEVYEVDGSEVVAVFDSLVEGENKIILTELGGLQDVFDLKIVNGSVEFDFIIDPQDEVILSTGSAYESDYPPATCAENYGVCYTAVNSYSGEYDFGCWFYFDISELNGMYVSDAELNLYHLFGQSLESVDTLYFYAHSDGSCSVNPYFYSGGSSGVPANPDLVLTGFGSDTESWYNFDISSIVADFADSNEDDLYLFVTGNDVGGAVAYRQFATNSYGADKAPYLVVDYAVSEEEIPTVAFTGQTPAQDDEVYPGSVEVDLATSDDGGRHYSFVDLDDHLKGWWRLESDTSAFDDSGNDLTGVLVGSFSSVSGRWGNALEFDGSSERINLGDLDVLDEVEEATVSAWIYPSSASSSDGAVFSLGPSYFDQPFVLWRDEDTTDHYAFSLIDSDSDPSGTFYSSAVPQADSWTHLVWTFEGGNVARLYVNGVEDSNSPFDMSEIDDIGTTTEVYCVGGDSGLTQMFEGSIDDLLIFDRVLSEDEVLSLYDSEIYSYSNFFDSLIESGTHEIQGFAVDQDGNFAGTEVRSFEILESLSSCGVLNEDGKTYVLVNDIPVTGNCIHITADNVVLDGNGYSIGVGSQDFGRGVFLDEVSNVTVKNLEVIGFGSGISILNSNGSLILNNTVYCAGPTPLGNGIYVSGFDNYLFGNSVSNNVLGLEIDVGADNNTIENNILSENIGTDLGYGVRVRGSNNTILNNSFVENNKAGVSLWPTGSQNVLLNNLFLGNGEASIEDFGEGGRNILIYNNSYGEIRWIDVDFLMDMSFVEDLGFGVNLSISENFVELGEALSGSGIYSAANVTLYGLGGSYFAPVILKDGISICDETTSPSCYAFTSLNDPTVVFNVSSWSNYSVGDPDQVLPQLEFVFPTPSSDSFVQMFGINLSSSDDRGDHYSFIEFDDDVVLWARMESVEDQMCGSHSLRPDEDCEASIDIEDVVYDGFVSLYSGITYTLHDTENYLRFSRRGGPYYDVSRAFVEWDISSILDGSTVQDVDFVYHCGSSVPGLSKVTRVLNNRPSDPNLVVSSLYNEIGQTGSSYYSASSCVGQDFLDQLCRFNPTSNREVDLAFCSDSGISPKTDLENQLSEGWFAVGLKASNEVASARQNELYSTRASSATPYPTLRVVYTSPVAVSGNPIQTAGYWGNAFAFDGVDDYVLFDEGEFDESKFDFLNGEFSVSLWFKTDDDRGIETVLVGKKDQWSLGTYNNKFTAILWNEGVFVGGKQSSLEVNDGEWHRVVAIFDPSSRDVELYLDGAEEGSSFPNLRNYGDADYPVMIGAYGDSGSQEKYYLGVIDEVLVFNRSLNSEELEALGGSGERDLYTEFSSFATQEVHDFEGFAVDMYGNRDSVGRENVFVDLFDPDIEFFEPTPVDEARLGIPINLSTNDTTDHYSFVEVDSDLLAWVRMDSTDSDGSPIDSSSYDSAVSRSDDAHISSGGYWGNAFAFDGSGDLLTLPFGAGTDPSVIPQTYSMWVQTDHPEIEAPCFYAGLGSADRLYFGKNDGVWDMGIRDENWGLGETGATTDWTHLALVMNGTDALFYVNGTLDRIKNYGSFEYRRDFILGGWHPDDSLMWENWDGLIDEVLIFNRSLNSSEVASLYDSSVNSYFHNFTFSVPQVYSFEGFAVDRSGRVSSTGVRDIELVDTFAPAVSFVDPTPADSSVLDYNSLYANVSVVEGDSVYSFIDFDSQHVLWYRFDNDPSVGESDSWIYDWSENLNDHSRDFESGTVMLGVPSGPVDEGKFGGAFAFDGDDHIPFGASNDIDGYEAPAKTISVWFNVADKDLADEQVIYEEGSSIRGFGIYVYDGSLYAGAYNTMAGESRFVTFLSTSDIDSDTWHNVVLLLNGSSTVVRDDKLVGYLDGVEFGRGPAGVVWGHPDSISIGYSDGAKRYYDSVDPNGQLSSDPNYFVGMLDELLIFKNALSPEEIVALHGVESQNYFKNYTHVLNGDHTLQAFAVDALGNLGQTSERTITTDVVGGDSIPLYDCGLITESNLDYTLQQDISEIVATCFLIQASNVTINGNGHSVTSLSPLEHSYVVLVSESEDPYTNVTVENFVAYDFWKSFDFFFAVNSTVRDNFIDTDSEYNFNSVGFGVGLGLVGNNASRNVIQIGSEIVDGIYVEGNRSFVSNNSIELVDLSNGISVDPDSVDTSIVGNRIVDAEIGIYIRGDRSNILENFIVDSVYALDFYDYSNSSVEGNEIWNNSLGVRMRGSSSNNTFRNNLFSGHDSWSILDESTGQNYFEYLNSEGEIRWIDPDFLGNLSFEGDLVLGDSLRMENNLFDLKSGLFSGNLSSPANITFYGIGDRGFEEPVIFRDNYVCQDCVNFTALDEDTVKIGVPSWSAYSIGENTTLVPPLISFEDPTPEDDENHGSPLAVFNISSMDVDGHYIFLDLDNDLALWMRMDDAVVSQDCYQETATQSTTCGGLAGGSYTCSGTWSSSYPCSNVYDGDWNTNGRASSLFAIVQTVYEIPAGADRATTRWSVKDGEGTEDLEIPESCWYDGAVRFYVRTNNYSPYLQSWSCFVEEGYTLRLREGYSSNGVYEEAMIWGFDDGVLVDDLSSWSNEGIGTGELSVTGGVWGDAFSFDGSEDKITISDSESLNSPDALTVSAWVRSDLGASGVDNIITKYDGLGGLDDQWRLYSSGSSATFNVYDSFGGSGSAGSQGAAPIGSWTHLVGVFNGTQISLYSNGDLVSSSSFVAEIPSSALDVVIGEDSNPDLNSFEGDIDEVLVFNRALNGSEVLALYNANVNQYSSEFVWEEGVDHEFIAHAVDKYGNKNETERWSVWNLFYPLIDFTEDTPLDGDNYIGDSIFVGLETSDNTDHYSFVDFSDDLVLWLTMDDRGSGTISDLSQYSNDGIAAGTPIYNTSSAWGEAAHLDGSTEYYTFADSESLDLAGKDFTVSFWVYLRSDSNQDIVSKFDGTNFEYLFMHAGGDSTLRFYTGSSAGGTYASRAISQNAWHHVVGRHNSSNTDIFIDTVAGTQATTPQTPDAASTALNIGRRATGANLLNGALDEIMIFNRTLTNTEIGALYNATATQYSHNFTGLSLGAHSFTGYAVDELGTINQTEVREVLLGDFGPPNIEFVTPPTPANQSRTSNRFLPIRISSKDASDHFVFTELDGDLALWSGMDLLGEVEEPVDASNFSRNGTVFGSVEFDLGKWGNASWFDGDPSNRLEFPVGSGIDPSVTTQTYSMWVKSNTVPQTGVFFSIGSLGDGFFLGSLNGYWDLGSPTEIWGDGFTPITEEWTHIVLSLDGSEARLYIDGVLDQEKEYSSSTFSRDIVLGNFFVDFQTRGWNGAVDELLMFDRVLTLDEIQSLSSGRDHQYDHIFDPIELGNHTFRGYAVDELGWTNSTNPRVVEFANKPPTVELISPLDGSSVETSVPTFVWDGHDPDSETDILDYQLNISLVGSGLCYEPERIISGIYREYYTLTQDLECFYMQPDEENYYLWSVRARDPRGYGEWSEVWSVNVTPLVNIRLTNSVVDFGEFAPGDSDDTTGKTGSAPFVLENIGDADVDVSVWSTDLWTLSPNPSEDYQVKVDSTVNNIPGIKYTSAIEIFTPMPGIAEPLNIITGLKSGDEDNDVEVDLSINVPQSEPPATKTSTVTFTATLGR